VKEGMSDASVFRELELELLGWKVSKVPLRLLRSP
jgi:hypothetical protein